MTATPEISLEFFPPKPGEPDTAFWDAMDRLGVLSPAFVSITYGAGGSTRERSNEFLHKLLARGDTRPSAHLTCIGQPREAVDAIARGWAEAGIRHMVALRGDMPELGAPFVPHPLGYRNTVEMIAGMKRIAAFDIAVGAYPESHPDSPSPEADLDNLKRKLDAGASLAITQYFFDAEVFLRFRDRARRAGIEAPIVPGIMPVANFRNLLNFSRRCGASVPSWLRARFEGLDADPETRALVAATTASALCTRLQAEGVGMFHFYTLNRAQLTYAVCRMLGIRPKLEKAA